ncbi:MAG: capsular polysaccharide biosynthesis protein CapF [Lachnospiraceae bacterium]|nr:capsular polysaccharide biosynthesis protein CapF [Lachnospiraceae bacterium]
MKVLVTGSDGFMGKNLIQRLRYTDDIEIYPYDISTDPALLDEYVKDCDVVFHLAGINRPKDAGEYMEGNFGFTGTLINALRSAGNTKAKIIVSSSIQAALDNPYGVSKKAGEDLVFGYAKETGASVVIYRFPNVFGKWCRPDYNSAVATFCHNIARGLPIKVNDPETKLTLVYIDDVVDELIECMYGREHVKEGFGYVPTVYDVKLGRIPELLYSFADGRKKLQLPDFSEGFEKKLYSTYISYIPEDDLSYPLTMHKDERGSFTEFLRTDDRGQVSVNISRPGIVKGGHWHNTKNEKFLVVKGTGLIRLRKIGSTEVTEYRVSGDDLTVVDIPCGYTHTIANTGDEDMVTVMWVNEAYNPDKGDTYREEV